jgi:hypothetical protein
MTEFVVDGLLITPFVRYALVAAVLMLILRWWLVRLHFYRWLWHPLLAEAAAYICLVAFLNLVF